MQAGGNKAQMEREHLYIDSLAEVVETSLTNSRSTGKSMWQANKGFCSFLLRFLIKGFDVGRVQLKVPLPMQLWVASKKTKKQHRFMFFG